jgi:hypothetical protein
VQQREEYTSETDHSASGEISQNVGRRIGGLVLSPEHGKRSRDRDVVDIVACHAGVLPFLPEAGHPRVDQAGIGSKQDGGPEAELFQDSGAERVNQDVGTAGEGEGEGDARGRFEIDAETAFAASEEVNTALAGVPVDTEDGGTVVGKQLAGEGAVDIQYV